MSKIIFITTPSSSYINPVLPIVKNLIDNYKVCFIVYSTVHYKTQIEKTGALFRQFLSNINSVIEDSSNVIKPAIILKNKQRLSRVALFISELVDLAEYNTLNLAKEIIDEKPDLILFESSALHAKIVIRLLKEHFDYPSENKNELIPIPQILLYTTTFMQEKNIYPNEDENQICNSFNVDELIKIAIDKEFLLNRCTGVYEKLKIKFIDPYEETFTADPKLTNLVLVMPDLHPRILLYNKNTKFIGTVINEDLKFYDFNTYESAVKCILQEFQPVSPIFSITRDKKLIYVHLKDKLNENGIIYLKLLKAFSQMDDKQFFVLFSINKKCEEDIKKISKDNGITMGTNIKVSTKTPKLEILKRSNVFITNCDLPSVNESLYYGIPMMCIPVTSNQMLISFRVAVELGLGKFIDFTQSDSFEILNAIHDLTNDCSFKNNCMKFSNFFKEHDVENNACKIILESINACRKSQSF